MGKPIILVTAHFGPLHLAGYFLRAFGFPVATYVANPDLADSVSRRAKDQLSFFPEIPHIFSAKDPLRNVYRFLEKGNILRVAFDMNVGKQLQVSYLDREVDFATGSIRLAIANGATLIPYAISEVKPWKFIIHVGHPVPPEFLAGSPDIEKAAIHILSECCQFFKSAPLQAELQIFHPQQNMNETHEL